MSLKTLAALALATLSLTACQQVKPTVSQITALLPDHILPASAQPVMRWDHRPEAQAWTKSTMAAIATEDSNLAARVPADIEGWCPAYEKASIENRRAFWSGLLSAVAKYESSWNPAATAGKGRYIGVMQISPKSAANYNCDATTSKLLKDGAANLQCAVKMMARQVGRDGLVAGDGNRGIGRDWMPLHKKAWRADMKAWTSKQAYCQ
jgi:soluble lytic murein transglycosylase-like protein